ncbi:MAG: CRTAC1 family protein [Pseudomonadota bacterium]
MNRYSSILHSLGCLSATAIVLAAFLLSNTARAEVWIDASASSGLDFEYRNGMTGEFWFPEIMGAGAAVFDYDDDGRMDVYLVQGGFLGPDTDQATGSDRLFRNVSTPDASGRLALRFRDVTEQAGIDARAYGMGVAAGDLTGDGHPDLYVLNYGPNQLFRNNGDGTFTDITESAGVAGDRWSVSGSITDLDGDGLAELMVINYVDFTLDNHRVCRSAMTSQQDYCSPSAYDGVPDRLYRNLGEGRFEDVSESSGIQSQARHGLGVVASDLNKDGRIDLYVANDGVPNALWLNQGELRFEDDAFLAGVAVNAGGKSEAGMGVDAADFDESGGEDLFITHMRMETNTLYRNDGSGWFTDTTSRFGLGTPSLGYTGFGTAWLDANNDGWLDLVVANGAVVIEETLAAAGDVFPYHQGNQLFLNQGGERFADATDQAGPALSLSEVSRGLAIGDLDNDGRDDLIVANINAPSRVLLNVSAEEAHWLGLELVDDRGRVQTQAVAWLLDEEGQRERRRRSRTDGSYASALDHRVRFGLADQSRARAIEVVWSDGGRERFDKLAIDQYHRVERGSGESVTGTTEN